MKKSIVAGLLPGATPRAVFASPRAGATDPAALIVQLNTAFNEFRTKNDARLTQLENGGEDAVTKAEIETLNTTISELQSAIDDQATKIAASQLNSGERKVADPEYTAAFGAHMKKGAVEASLNKGAADEGGYLAPTEWDRTITDKLIEVSPMRSIASVQTIGSNGFKKLFNLRGTASGWVGEAAARPETDGPTFGELAYPTGELYANPAATQQMLDDAEVNLESWLANEVDTEFAYQEGVAFVSGNGVNKPNGILTYVTGGANAASHPFGAIQAVNTTESAIGGLDDADDLINLVQTLPTPFTQGASFAMNRTTIGKIRLLKDTTGQYLWQPSLQAGQPSTLLGYPVREMAAMPDVAANALPIMFGDFRRGYLIVDRVGTRVLRDPFTNKPYVHFYTTKRVGGGALNTEVLKALKIRAA